MNAEAEAEIKRILEVHCRDGNYAWQMMREAMRWAYKDAIRVCQEEHLSDELDDDSDESYDMALEHAAEAIEERMK